MYVIKWEMRSSCLNRLGEHMSLFYWKENLSSLWSVRRCNDGPPACEEVSYGLIDRQELAAVGVILLLRRTEISRKGGEVPPDVLPSLQGNINYGSE